MDQCGRGLRKSVSTDDLGDRSQRNRKMKGGPGAKRVAKAETQYHSVERLPTLTPFDEERICWLKVVYFLRLKMVL